ncbi:cation/H+ exchanger 4 [Hibiscus trionum]|uniref:Cation/H+ exchanger 4 n=1 Tax=Hibiscus trionum TaxID=183268 RepID=A0A9W7IEE3_HIBTR|nr:cation/H+ exchanger 4 [Hibiscus trionum]
MGHNIMGNSSKTVEELTCLRFPPEVISPGLIVVKPENLMDYSWTRLQLQIIVIFLLTQAIHCVLKHFRVSIFTSQILAGIILGPTVFKSPHSLITMSEDSVAILGTVASFGYMLFLFLTGVKMDVSMTYRSGKKPICIGILTVVVPFIVCMLTFKYILDMDQEQFMTTIAFNTAVLNSRTSFPVIYCLLNELKLLNSELGRVGLSAALVGDMLSLFILTICQGVIAAQRLGFKIGMKHLRGAVGFIVLVLFCLGPLLKRMVRKTGEGGKIKRAYLYTAILAFTISHKLSELLGVFILVGPFLVGLVVPDGPPLGSALVEKFDPVVSGFLMPLFAATCGMRVDLSYLKNPSPIVKEHALAAVVTTIAKFGISFLLSFICNMPTRDSLAFGFIMINKGIVDMATYSNINDYVVNYMPMEIFACMTIIIVVTASIVPMLVKALYDPSRKYACYQKRSIMHCKLNEELRMLTCIHVPANVNSLLQILNVTCLTRQSPISLHVLHLIKLSGRATPLFISHDKNWKNLSDNSYSENVVLAFNQFERDNWGAVSVKVFTAVSPMNLMYEDICNLAQHRQTSFIILPFHRRWHVDGNIESEDQIIRSMNNIVLEKAPCSVGILVEGRGHVVQSSLDNSSSFSIAVIFLGGKDDEEALALGRRMSQNKNVKLTIIHLKAGDVSDTMQDEEMLRNVKQSGLYIEKQVNDGTETSKFLRSIVDNYQLFIVGRRYKREDPQTIGLHEWMEFPEIGIIGDLLSSADFSRNNSVLIVQQQQQ